MNWMIYGAYGYSGEQLARQAKMRGMTPILAGRNEEKTKKLAQELGLEYRAFSVDDPELALSALKEVEAVLNCAGPFGHTFQQMISYCLETKTHYLDITGEIEVFEAAARLNLKAKERGIVVCPGTGFDVVPTDCLASKLKELLPDATHLSLGFTGMKDTSAGTAKTTVEGIAQGGRARVYGDIKRLPLGGRSRMIDFGKGERLAVAIPWGDVSTAYYSTGIPNIEVYTGTSKSELRAMKLLNVARPLLSLSWIQNFLKKQIQKKVKGPDETRRSQQKSYVWGEAKNSVGKRKVCRIQTANGYDLTFIAPLKIIQKLSTDSPDPGFYTPSLLMGKDFVTTLEGSGQWVCD